MDSGDDFEEFGSELDLHNAFRSINCDDDNSCEEKYNRCCDTDMQLDCNNNFVCAVCQCIKRNFTDRGEYTAGAGNQFNLSVSDSNGKRIYMYSGTGNYLECQRKNLLRIYNEQNNISKTIKLSDEMIIAMCNLCQLVIEKDVKRTKMLREIMAACMFYECLRVNRVYKHSEIAEFMQLDSRGFSRGESILLRLATRKIIDIPQAVDTTDPFLDRYFEHLPLDPIYKQTFAKPFITTAQQHAIGVQSKIASKCAGAIWLLVGALNMRDTITLQLLDRVCNVRKNTLINFCNSVLTSSKKEVFEPVYEAADLRAPWLPAA